MKLKSLLDENKKDHFYIMHLSYGGRDKKRLWDYAKENKIIGLDHPDVFKQSWIDTPESIKNKISGLWVRQFDMFCYEMEKDDVVVVLNGWHYVLGITECVGEYNHDKSLSLFSGGAFFGHIRHVEWKKVYNYDEKPLPHPVLGFNNTLSEVNREKKWWDSLVSLEI